MVLHFKSNIKSVVNYMLAYIFKPLDIHVKMSRKGRTVLNDHKLAAKVVDTILKNKEGLQKGDIVTVEGENVSIEVVTTIDESLQREKNK